MVQVALTRQEFEAKALLLRQRGIEVAGDKGVLAKSGCKVAYAYDGSQLTCTVVGHPFLVSIAYVEGQLREWLGEHG